MKKHEFTINKNNVTGLDNTYTFLNEPSSLFEVEENTTLTLVDIITKDIDVQRTLVVHKNATLNYIKIGKSMQSANITYLNDIQNNGTLHMSLYEFGASTNSVQTTLKNNEVNFTLNGLIDLKDDSQVEYDIQTNHQSKSLSDIEFTNLLDDKSSAKIKMFSVVEENGAFSKAFQNSQTILLSDDSFVAVTPHLEISIDELEASHGATCGDLDIDSIYYLQSRGISEKDAKVMLLNALRDEVYDKLNNQNLSEYIKGLL